MNIINFPDSKGRNKNQSKNKQDQKQFLLPTLNPKKDIQPKISFLPFQCVVYKNQIKPINNNIKNQLKKQRNSIQNRIYEQQRLLKNHKPYSGNPSSKGNNNNNVEYNIPLLNDNQFVYEREILTANPSLIASKINFNNNNKNKDNNKQVINNIKLNNSTNKNQLLSMKNKNNSNNNIYNSNRNILKGKEIMRENISAKYQYYQDKVYKCFRKMGIGISKSSPKISSIEIISKPYECQKQKDNDYHKNIKIVNNNNNFNYNNNMIQIKKINMDCKNINDFNKLLLKEKNKQINSGKMGGNMRSNAESQNMQMNAVGLIKLKLDKKHFNVKSASIIDINNSMNIESSKKKNNNYNIKILKNSSINCINSLNSINNQATINLGLNNTSLSTINNSSINRNNNDINKNNKPKISKCFISYAYHDYPNLEHRQEMEDFHCIKQALGKKPNLSYFSIFDGHGGKEVASFLSLNFHRTLSKEINSINFTTKDEDNINTILEKIKNSFESIDQEILKNDKLAVDVGSTATIILIYYNNIDKEKKDFERFLICANVGDSNGFLINKNYIKLITKGHNCYDALEVKRIKDQGGIVFQGRIFGKLILTRTLGDKEMKKYGVIPEPDFFVKKIENEDIFIVIGSDGIWDVINQEETFRVGIEKGLSSEEFSQKLIKISEERDTRDNASCIVVKLNKNV